jgi:hypothetical protein
VENLTLDKVRRIARTYELSVTHASKMDKGDDSTKYPKEEEVNKVQKKKRTQFKPRGAPRTLNRPPPTKATNGRYRPCKMTFFQNERRYVLTPKSFLLVLKFIEYDQIK